MMMGARDAPDRLINGLFSVSEKPSISLALQGKTSHRSKLRWCRQNFYFTLRVSAMEKCSTLSGFHRHEVHVNPIGQFKSGAML
jgi:hypothetical protein